MPELAGVVVAYSMTIELSVAPSGDDVIRFAHTLGVLTAASDPSIDGGIITIDSSFTTSTIAGFGFSDTSPQVYFESASGPTTADITIAHARAAFLVI